VVSDEEEEEEERLGSDSPADGVETLRIFIKHTPSELVESDGSGDERFSGDDPFSSTSPRHPGEISAPKPTPKPLTAINGALSTPVKSSSVIFAEGTPEHVSEANLILSTSSTSSSKTTFKEMGEKKSRRTCFAESSPGDVEKINDAVSGLATPPFSTPPPNSAEPRSILKKNRRNVSAKFRIADEDDNSSSCDDEIERRVIGKNSGEFPRRVIPVKKSAAIAVAEEIKERDPIPIPIAIEKLSISPKNDSGDFAEKRAISTHHQTIQQPPKRVSKFKQQRQNRS